LRQRQHERKNAEEDPQRLENDPASNGSSIDPYRGSKRGRQRLPLRDPCFRKQRLFTELCEAGRNTAGSDVVSLATLELSNRNSWPGFLAWIFGLDF
jgi:hypothetical protein